MIERLLIRLNRVFNKKPKAVSAITVTSLMPGFSMTLDNLILNLVTAEATYSFDLSTLTIWELVTAINTTGQGALIFDEDTGYLLYDETTTIMVSDDVFTASLVNPSFRNLSARAVLLGDGDIQYPTNLLYNEYQVYEWTLGEVDAQRQSAERQLYANTAQDGWLEYWLSYFNSFRNSNESDASFFQRAISEIFAPKVNNKAIMKIIYDATGYYVDVRDMLGTDTTSVFYKNITHKNTTTQKFDSSTYIPSEANTFGVYIYNGDIRNLSDVDKNNIIGIVNRVKASGKKVKYFAPTGILIKNQTIKNSSGFVKGPVPGGWLEVDI